jgi:hypothetical protein
LIREKIEVPPIGPDDFVNAKSYFEMHVNVRAAIQRRIPLPT